jgi:hypothetical protein
MVVVVVVLMSGRTQVIGRIVERGAANFMSIHELGCTGRHFVLFAQSTLPSFLLRMLGEDTST